MRTSGFPCRLLGCDQVFHVADQNSMAELHTASAARSAHEVSAHGYHHVQLTDAPWRSPYQGKKPRPIADAGPSERRR
jgi:hypothetical protein